MASIPLPALDVKPAATPPNAIEQYAQMMGIRNAQIQQQIGQQDVQKGQLDLQDRQAANAAMQEWGAPKTAPSSQGATGATTTAALAPNMAGLPSRTTMSGAVNDPATGAPITAGSALTVNGPASASSAAAGAGVSPPSSTSSSTPAGSQSGDSSIPNYNDLIGLYKKHGASAQAVMGLQSKVLEMQSQASTIAKNDAEAGTSNLNAIKSKNGMIADAMGTVLQAPDAQLPQAILATAQQLRQDGLIDPQHLQMAQQIAQGGDPNQMRMQIGTYRNSILGYSQLLDEAGKQAGINTQNAEHGPLTPDQVQQLNQGLTQRYQVLNPDKPVPGAFQLQAGSTPDDFSRVDKLLSGTESAKATAASMANSLALRQQSLTMMAGFHQAALQNTQNQQLNQSFQYSNNFVENSMKPLQQASQRLGRLQATIAQANPQADALVAPELLSVMAGGSGSGLRMNESEIARVIGGATQWTKLQQNLNKWSTDPAHVSIPPVQRGQIEKLVNYVAGQANDQLNIGMQAQQDLIQATSAQEHHQILAKFSRQFNGSVTNQSGTGGGAQPRAGMGQQTNQSNGNDSFAQFGGRAH